MPAPVPAGYTRGSLVLLGPAVADEINPTPRALRQWLWREAGGFGARLVVVAVDATHGAAVRSLCAEFATWESDQVHEIMVPERSAARGTAHLALVEQATGIVLVGNEPQRWASTLGGTPLAQAIRRAHARSKLVAGIGAAGTFLCQHTITPGEDDGPLSEVVRFGPGLGLVNRLVVDATSQGETLSSVAERRLLAAVATNPFLIGIGLAANSAAILYSDETLHASGPNAVTVMDGHDIEAAALGGEDGQDVVGVRHYTLHTGESFHLVEHTLRSMGEIDLPPVGRVTSVF